MKELGGVMGAAQEVEVFCQSQGWKFCFIGGIAVQRWGSPRFTQDVDLTLLTGFGEEGKFIDALLAKYPGRLREARKFALENRIVLARSGNGIDLDFALGAYPFEEASIGRATSWRVNEQIALTTCSAEDLVIHKVFASRDRDWGDVESILARQFGNLDLGRIRRDLAPLLELKEDGESLERFERVLMAVQNRMEPG